MKSKQKALPEILVFSCNWAGWSCIEAATNSGLHYPACIKALRVSCLSRLHIGLILKAFECGADGVMLLGCEPGGCHFDTDWEYISNECAKAQNILELLGMQKERLVLVQLPAFDGHQFVTQATKLLDEINQESG